jgi:Ferritin-like
VERRGSRFRGSTSIKYVVREEMLHAALAANLLNAVGGGRDSRAKPSLAIPSRCATTTPSCRWCLAPASVDLVRQVFLRIEQPEEPGGRPEADRYETLAQFYEAIVGALVGLGDEVFTGDPRAQVTKGYAGHGGGTLFAVTDRDSALLAIEVIDEQGEGTHTSAPAPVGFDGTTRPTHLKLEPFGFQGPRNARTITAVRCLLLAPDERDGAVWGVGDESPLIDSAMVSLMNHAEKPIALALLREAWP